MDDNFESEEKLYRAVFPPEKREMFWKSNGQLSSAAFYDPKGLSVDRGNYRSDDEVVNDMSRRFVGRIIAVSVGQCRCVDAKVKYKPTSNIFHTEIHGSDESLVLDKIQRKHLARCAEIVAV